MRTLLPWQLKSFARTQLYERTLSSYLVHVLLGTKHITGLPGLLWKYCCYLGQQENFAITQLNESILGSNLAHTFPCDNIDHWFPWFLWKHCCHGNQKIVQLLNYLKES